MIELLKKFSYELLIFVVGSVLVALLLPYIKGLFK